MLRPKPKALSPFPADFLWGASTAAYQVEGGLTNQWSEWEKVNAERLAHEIPKELRAMRAEERQARGLYRPENYINDTAVGHYNRYKEDFDLLEQLNLNSFRFGIAWERIEPREGEWDAAAIRHYKNYIAELRRRGIEPVPTLWWWTLPLWFTAKGGFQKKRNVRYFERFARKVTEEFGADLRYLLILNEPNVYMSISYLLGKWPPQYHNPFLALRVYCNLIRAHKAAYVAIKQLKPNLQVSLAYNFAQVKASNPKNPVNNIVVKLANYLYNYWFLDRIEDSCDFIGVNWYHTQYINWMGLNRNPAQPKSDLRWYMEPQVLAEVLIKTGRRYHKPLLVTENGLADSSDSYRTWWLEKTIEALQTALASGAQVIGYLHWSLLDNFEWSYGWWPKFGLVAVDREHGMKRTIRPSAKWFSEQLKNFRSHN